MEVTPKSIKAAYDLLRVTAFNGIKVRPSSKVKFVSKRLPKHHGLYYFPEHKMVIDAHITSVNKLLQTVAHEMSHAVLDNNGDKTHHTHDKHFQTVADTICSIMGWPKGSV
jgi:Zn-dependent peptidase ImmA (M78 family)